MHNDNSNNGNLYTSYISQKGYVYNLHVHSIVEWNSFSTKFEIVTCCIFPIVHPFFMTNSQQFLANKFFYLNDEQFKEWEKIPCYLSSSLQGVVLVKDVVTLVHNQNVVLLGYLMFLDIILI